MACDKGHDLIDFPRHLELDFLARIGQGNCQVVGSVDGGRKFIVGLHQRSWRVMNWKRASTFALGIEFLLGKFGNMGASLYIWYIAENDRPMIANQGIVGNVGESRRRGGEFDAID